MSGFESNRFVNLTENFKKHLICSICLNIYNNAVKSECEHTFCKSCVQNWIQNNHKECPECRTGFTTRKRTTSLTTDLNLWNGCQDLIELGLLSTHLLECEHRLCKTCGFTVGRDVEHNCLELMKTDRNQLKAKLNEITAKNSLLEEKMKINEKEWNKKFNEMKDKNKRLENELKLKGKETEQKTPKTKILTDKSESSQTVYSDSDSDSECRKQLDLIRRVTIAKMCNKEFTYKRG